MMICFFSREQSGILLYAELATVVLYALGKTVALPWLPLCHLWHGHCMNEKISPVLLTPEPSFQYVYQTFFSHTFSSFNICFTLILMMCLLKTLTTFLHFIFINPGNFSPFVANKYVLSFPQFKITLTPLSYFKFSKRFSYVQNSSFQGKSALLDFLLRTHPIATFLPH